MAPAKQTRVTKVSMPSLSSLTLKKTVATRSSRSTLLANISRDTNPKRKADGSPSKDKVTKKRAALGDLTNKGNGAILEKTKNILKGSENIQPLKKIVVQTKVLPTTKTIVKPKLKENLLAAPVILPGNKILTRATIRSVQCPAASNSIAPNRIAQKPKEIVKEPAPAKAKTRLSDEFEKTEESLYSTALEEINDSSSNSANRAKTRASSVCSDASNEENKPSNMSLVAQQMQLQLNLGNHEIPEGVTDFDQENWDDIVQVSHYAMDIFNYLKEREESFIIPDYMARQVCLNPGMRAMLVDWMVEIQESFELNHESLYLGVKLVDMYLSKMTVGKETLQLVGAAAMLVACKYDERIPPAIDDFLYVCDGAYTRRELIRMEINLLKVCNFELGVPLSYRFLRRYARCAKIAMPVLTLARYILELSIGDYSTVSIRDSKLAAASLYLAVKMVKVCGWTKTLEFYSGYKLEEIIDVVYLLNNILHKKPKDKLHTVRNKYSHEIFFEVAKTPTLKNEQLRP